jgi:hypothetical protein
VASANHVFIFDFVGLFQPTPTITTTAAAAASAAVGSSDPRRQNQVLLQRLMGSLLQQLFSSEEIVKVGWSFGVADIRMLRKSGQGIIYCTDTRLLTLSVYVLALFVCLCIRVCIYVCVYVVNI